MKKSKGTKAATPVVEAAPVKGTKAAAPKYGLPEHGRLIVPTTTEAGKESRSITKGATIAHYVKGEGRTTSGKATFDIADRVADELRGLDVESLFKVAHAKLEGFDARAKYGHLNPGQIRMNIGNRLRAAYRKAS